MRKQGDTAGPGLDSPRAWLGPLMVLGGGVCIGLAPIGLRLGLETLGPQAIAFWRYTIATPILLLILVTMTRRLPFRPNRFVIIAGICFALDIGLWHWALERTTVANATFIVNLGNISVGLMAWLFLRERPTALWGVAVAIAVAGAAFLSQGGLPDGKTSLQGDLLALAAAFLVSGYMLASSITRRQMSAIDAIFWLTAVESAVAFCLVAVSGERFFPETLDGFRAPLFLAIAVQIAGQGLIIAGLGRTPAAIAGVLVLVQPVTAAAISWQMFDEALTLIQGMGGLLILVGVFLAQRSGRVKVAPSQPVSEASHSSVKGEV